MTIKLLRYNYKRITKQRKKEITEKDTTDFKGLILINRYQTYLVLKEWNGIKEPKFL